MRKKLFLTTLAALVMVAGVAANSDEDLEITPRGYGSFEFGQIGHGYYHQTGPSIASEISHVNQQRAFANLGFTARYNDILEIELIGEGMTAFSYPQMGNLPNTMQPRNFYYIKSSNATIHLQIPELAALNFQVGLFPYKYNRDVSNLGEYLFRSTPYPLVIFSDFDYPKANLLGVRANQILFDSLFVNDLMLHSEIISHPVQNWSLSDVAEVNIVNMLSLGGGLSLYHVFSAYQGNNADGSLDRLLNPDGLSDEQKQTLGIRDSVPFSTIKLMGRAAIDTREILNRLAMFPEILGESNVRLYGELDILGLNKVAGYEDIGDRTIWSFGANIRFFNIIDQFNAELEYCPNGTAYSDSRYYTDKPSLRPDSLPVDPNSLNGERLVRSKLRWSYYIKKSFINNHFSIIAQVARDHKKMNFYYFEKAYMTFEEALPTQKDWWWMLKTEYTF